jgi:xylulokinase
MELYLGLDLGTSSLKATLANPEGKIIRTAKASYPSYSPHPNWSEQDPEDWAKALRKVLKELSEGGVLKDLKAISFSGQMHGLVLLDEHDKVIRKALLWNDSRTEGEVDYLNNGIGEKTLIQETSNIALCGFTAPKVLWVRKHEPDNFARIRKAMLPKDYLSYLLSGVFASDVSDLSGTLYFDVKKGRYSKKMLDILSLDESVLPTPHESYEAVGKIKPEIAREFGINEDCLIVIGGGDQAVGAVGTNTLRDGDAFISLGTSGVLLAARKDHSYDPEGRFHSFRDANSHFLLMGCTLSAASSLAWWADVLGKKVPDVVKDIPERITPVIYLPYLMGERSPINDPKAVGAFYGLNAAYSTNDLTKAVLEGVAFSLYDVYKAMNEAGLSFKYARLIGGGAQSEAWAGIIADVFGLPMRLISTADGAAYGAIALAIKGAHPELPLEDIVSRMVKDRKEFKPDKKRHAIYEGKFRRYKELYERTKPLEAEEGSL